MRSKIVDHRTTHAACHTAEDMSVLALYTSAPFYNFKQLHDSQSKAQGGSIDIEGAAGRHVPRAPSQRRQVVKCVCVVGGVAGRLSQRASFKGQGNQDRTEQPTTGELRN